MLEVIYAVVLVVGGVYIHHLHKEQAFLEEKIHSMSMIILSLKQGSLTLEDIGVVIIDEEDEEGPIEPGC